MTNTFTVKIDGKDVVLEIKPASEEIQIEAHKVYNSTFADSIKSRALLRAKLEDFIREQGLWDERKEAEFAKLSREIRDNSLILQKGGININKAKAIALNLRKLRYQLRSLVSAKSELDSHTAEGQADNARFNYLVSACTVYNDTKKPVFANLADYLNQSTKEIGIAAATKYASIIYDVKENHEADLPENKFLVERGYVNQDLELVNSDGHLVDEDGRLIDKEGRYVDKEGNRVDIDGNRVNDSGELIVESLPFTDDEGNPV